MLNVDLKIAGDTYYLGDSGLGNYSATTIGNDNINSELQMNYQSSDISVEINYQTPIDIDRSTGLYSKTVNLPTFSGLYRVMQVSSTFKAGVFEQDLTLQRRAGQISNQGSSVQIERAVESPTPGANKL